MIKVIKLLTMLAIMLTTLNAKDDFISSDEMKECAIAIAKDSLATINTNKPINEYVLDGVKVVIFTGFKPTHLAETYSGTYKYFGGAYAGEVTAICMTNNEP